MSEKVTFIINDGPGKLKAWNALRLAYSLALEQVPVYVFLLDDGVFAAKKNQQPPNGLGELDLILKLQELLALGAEVEACTVCLNARGMEASEMLEGVKPAGMRNLAKAVKESDKVLVF